MLLRHILAATDESDAGRQAVRTAVDLATRASARITILRVEVTESSRKLVGVRSSPAENGDHQAALGYLHRWLQADVLSAPELAAVELSTAAGIPGIEICRVAEHVGADLVVLGRKRHSRTMRLLLGDTADAVARRSRVPCLFVPPGSGAARQVLAALDGTTRGLNVLLEACDFAGQTGAALKTVTVEQGPADEAVDMVAELPVARSSMLQGKVQELLARTNLDNAPLAIRRGEVLEWILAEVQGTEADLLAIGYHRGGPPGVLEAGSIARRLAHVVPCAVLTIPL
jgi:nucleotide-binding universal stress UspA family protein